MAGSTSYKKSSRFVIDRKMLTAGVMAFFVALAVVNNMALNVSVALQQGQAFSSSRCVMNEFSSSISTVIQRFYSRSNVHLILFFLVRRQHRRPERTSRST